MYIFDRIVFGILGAAVAVGLASCVLDYQSQTTAEDLKKSAVQIGEFCSGTVIPDYDLSDGNQATVLTAAHCVKDDQPDYVVKVDTEEGVVEYLFRLKNVNRTDDLAILQTDSETFSSNTMMAEIGGTFDYGEQVHAVTFPGNWGEIYSVGYASGVVLDPTVYWMENPMIQKATLQIYGGSSGGGAYGWDNGVGYVLKGVTIGGIPGTTYAVLVPGETIQKYLQRLGS
ncbi:MAG: trypsin-like peptidase domain-containing protein [Candidatus Obscuribacterales bacterium]